jgi:alpha-galactosidase
VPSKPGLIEVVGTEPAFHLRADGVSYLFRVTRHGHLEHVHFGPALGHVEAASDYEALVIKQAGGHSGVTYTESDPAYCLDYVPQEVSGLGKGDYRLPSVEVRLPDGGTTTDLRYTGHTLHEGVVPCQDGLPTAIAEPGQAATLEVRLADGDLELNLFYTVFAAANTVTRRTVLTNNGAGPVAIRRLMSQQVDLPDRGFDLVTFDGAWAAEAHRHVRPVAPGIYVNSSATGFSSNRHNPGVLLARRGAGEDHGEVYGFNLVYSGNHYTAVELSHREQVRVQSGINLVGFDWTLGPGERFESPEAVLSYSSDGFNGLSANLHAFVGDHIVRGEWADRPRPVLLNSWEAAGFDFTERSLLAMARQGKRLGVELFVLDDGWFGDRNDDRAGLGDWDVNLKKLPDGLGGLAAKVRDLGLDFGLWVEPEMVNPDSGLYREHPDWAIQLPAREPSLGRHQLVLDLTRDDVRDHIVAELGAVLDSAPISYVKWDSNRTFSDLYSATCPAGELPHRFVLGLYDVLRRVFGPRPQILLESCASGGNRFDLGMLCFSPQVWASDCTDPIERLAIQLGLSYLYPPSTIGAHVTASPSEQTLRATPLSTRFNVAAIGVLGYELDPRSLTPSERREVRAQIAFYKAHRASCQYGRLRRADPVRPGQLTVSLHDADGEPRLVGHYQTRLTAAGPPEWLPIPGLDASRRYRVTARPQSYSIRDFGRLVNHLSPVRISDGGTLQRLVDRYYRMPANAETYSGTGAVLSRLQLAPQFDGSGIDDRTRLLGEYGSTLYVVEAE